MKVLVKFIEDLLSCTEGMWEHKISQHIHDSCSTIFDKIRCEIWGQPFCWLMKMHVLSDSSVPADNCIKFAIDVGLELVILYEHIYEIYGDIQAATNSFKIQAYEQGEEGSLT